jgi:hypothetical protein
MLFLVKKITGKRGTRETLRSRHGIASSFFAKLLGEVFAHFHAVGVVCTVVWGIDCLACQDESFVNNPLGIKANYEHAYDFALHLSRIFTVSVSLDFPWTAHAFFPRRLSNHCQGLCRFFFSQDLHKICCSSFVGSLAKFHQIGYNTQNKKPENISTSTHFVHLKNVVHWLPKICKYYHLPLYRANTIAVQMAVPVPEIWIHNNY